MEINATTVADWVEKMNERVIDSLKNTNTANSRTWIGFASVYDTVKNQIEATYDSGTGSVIRVCYFDFKIDDNDDNTIRARAAVEDVKHNNAIINITNMRRHGFVDCMDLAERDNIDEKKRYWYFREHAKEHRDFEQPCFYSVKFHIWSANLCEGLVRAFDVGNKRQNKVGISDKDEVARAEFKKRLDIARNTIELLDTSYIQLNTACSNSDNVFDTISVKYNHSLARCYMNPYNTSMFAKIPCHVDIKLNKDKCEFDENVCESGLRVRYSLIYDEQYDTVSIEDFTYDIGWYMSTASLIIDSTMRISLDLSLNLGKLQVFGDNVVTIDEFKTRVLDKIVERVSKCHAAKKLLTE